MTISERIFYIICGAILLIGAVVFFWGGNLHPATDAKHLGAIGSEEFFRNFIRHIVEHGAWERIHAGILAGPLCWALGGVGAGLVLRQRGETCFSSLGAVALAMGATAWAVTFVCDGFVTLRHAEAVSSSSPDTVAALLADFRANQLLVVRLGLVSFILIGAGIAAFGASILAAGIRSRLVSWLLGAGGVLLGLWPLLAWAIGVFEPGPFTSPWWRPTATLTTLWFMSGGIAILTQATRATMSSGRRAGRE